MDTGLLTIHREGEQNYFRSLPSRDVLILLREGENLISLTGDEVDERRYVRIASLPPLLQAEVKSAMDIG